MLKQVMMLLAICACGASDDVSESASARSQSVVGNGSGSGRQRSGDECDPTPIDSKGTLPACVGGRSTKEGPGNVADAVIVTEPEPTAETKTATGRANQVMKARNPESQDLADRGFAPVAR